ncbi:sugar ABC transporter permease [Massilimicrobiota sp. An142]|uniref:ABC transporter permease n=1 Tax=Massilimicrobiota sp. An142 TaxID=1965564 RepID=UPI000B36DC6F|nr:ABC transporter permease [Massilimicrobiota sp. An142]OUQ11138.1 sugar ABC transporter permease [Massilimicrobiota sp. An142]
MSIVYFLFAQTLLFAIPLLVVALGGMFSERSGVINIALEGIMILGAFFGVFFINFMQTNQIMSGQALLILALLVSGIVGALFSLLHAFASIHLKADQTISGTALNLFAPAFGLFIAKTIQDGVQSVMFENQFRIVEVPILSQIPILGDLFFKNCYLTTFVGIFVLIISYVFLMKTKTGLRLRSCGENPQASDAAGISVYKMRYLGVILSGFLAGMGGLIYILPISTEFNCNVAGYGFLALAVLIFGNWKPWRIAGAAFFFGATKTIAYTYTSIPFLATLSLPATAYKLIPYLATLILLAFTSKNSAAPRAEGEPFDKGKR